MASTSSPTWYDVLGVDRHATPEQIKTAWRTATDKFEPGSGSGGQFRMFNEAADVLLDPASRAAYDATLPPSEPAPSAASVDLVKDPLPEQEPPAASAARVRRPASTRALLLTALLAVLTVAAVTAAVVFGLKVRTDSRIADARDEAPAAAESAAKAVLAYDYKTLPADRRRASSYLTPGFRKKYLKNFALLEKQKDGTPGAAVLTKTVVTATVVGSAVVAADDDRVRVLVYVNQVSKRPDKDPQIFQNRVTMTMEKHKNKWLVANLKSY